MFQKTNSKPVQKLNCEQKASGKWQVWSVLHIDLVGGKVLTFLHSYSENYIFKGVLF